MISVYDIGNTNYTGNGNAVLQPTECRLRNIAGGNYDLTMTHPIDPEGKWKHMVPGAIIKAPVPREEIENAFAGYDADVYKTTAQAELREGASKPTNISYSQWNWQTEYQVGDKVTTPLWTHKNYQCVYYDGSSQQIMAPPYNSTWWKPIADQTSGAPVLVTLPAGTDLYFVEDYDTDWYKMSTYYGVVGYIEKSKVTYDRHLTPSETKPRIITEQLFRIEKPTVDTKSRTVTLTAKHVSYDLAGILVRDVSISQASPAMALGRIVEAFMMDYEGTIATNLTSDDNGTYTATIKGKNGIFALLDPDKGIVSTFNAAYKRDNWDLFVLTKTLTDRGYRLKYRKNMLGVNWAQDPTGLVTRVVPIAKDANGADLYLPEEWIDSPLINNYPRVRMERLTVKGQVGKDKGTGDGSTWTESDLLAEMRTKAAERFSVDEADKITVTVTVDFEQLGDAEEHRELKGMETVLLYDRVTVENEEIGLSVQLYVSEWEWDAIREKITSLKLANTTDYKKGNVTGYNVQNKSIGSEKLTDEVTGEILQQAIDIMPEYAEPFDSQTHLNTKDRDGIVQKGSGQANKVWKTDGQGNPAWRDEQTIGDYIPTSEKGAPGGVATLDNAGKVPASELPSYVDDVLEYASRSAFPATGETGKIYVAIDTGKTYRWSGSTYIELSSTAVTDNDPTLAWGTRSKVGTVAGTDLHVTMPGNPASASDNDPTLAWGTRSKVGTVNGVELHVTLPANPNTDHYDWPDITNKPSYYDAKAVKNITRSGTTFTATCMDGTTFTFTQQDNDHYAWSDITNKPDTATRWPAWSEVTSKPENYPGGCTGNAGSATEFASAQSVELTGDTTGSASSKAGWSIATTTKKLAYNSTIGSSEALDAFLEANKFKTALWNYNNDSSPSWPGVGNGVILSGAWTSSDYGFQLAIDDDPGYFIALRQKNTNGWRAWKRIPMEDGTGASGTWGISITGEAGSVAWANVSSKPDTATRWPAWSEVTSKPDTATRWPNWGEIAQSGANNLSQGTSDFTDGTELMTSYATDNGFSDPNAVGVVYRRSASCMYNYIKGKAEGSWNITATSAGAFSSAKSVELTGDTTGSASSTGGWSIATTTSKISKQPKLTSNADLNAFSSDNKVKFATCSAISDSPGLPQDDGLIMDIPWSARYGHQLYFNDSGYEFYHRYNGGGTWSNWVRIVDENNIGSQTCQYAGSDDEGTCAVNSNYCTGSVSYKGIRIRSNRRIVTLVWDITFNGTYSSDNVAVISDVCPVPWTGGTIVVSHGPSAAYGNWGLVCVDAGRLRPWYSGNVSGHWLGSMTYITAT